MGGIRLAKQGNAVSNWVLKVSHMGSGDTEQSLVGKELSKRLVGNKIKRMG